MTLTATPASGSSFGGWGGACSGTATTCRLVLLGNTAVTATFTKDPPPTPPVPSTPSNAFNVRTPLLVGSAIRTWVKIPGPGLIRQSGTFSYRGQTRRACTTNSRAAQTAGVYRIRCTLTTAARTARKSGPLRVRLATTFTPTGGTARVIFRTVTIRGSAASNAAGLAVTG
ncbi:MAG: InlB B-repeat-containing protein [Gaiellales bacterium]